MNIVAKQVGSEFSLALSGRFDFNAHRDFRNGYEPALQNSSIKTLNLNMEKVDYLDSSALGMLLLLNEKARASNIEVIISSCPANIKKIIEVANFSRIFKIL
jgi:anti-anti-sigma factor